MPVPKTLLGGGRISHGACMCASRAQGRNPLASPVKDPY